MRFLLGCAAALLALTFTSVAQAGDYGVHSRDRGHYDYVPGHYDRHRGHYDYHPGQIEYHRAPAYSSSPSYSGYYQDRSYYAPSSYSRDRSYYAPSYRGYSSGAGHCHY